MTASKRRIAIATAIVFGAWTLVGGLLATQAWVSYAMRGEPIAWGRALGVWLAWAWLWALLTPVALKLVERYPLDRPRLARAATVHLLAGVALVTVDIALFAVLAPHVGALHAGTDWWATFSRLLGTTFLLNLPVYGLVVGVAQGLRLVRAARQRERRALQLEAQLAEARLLALQAQLQPHFLFNALNTVQVLMREDVDVADRILVLLSQLLRRALESCATQELELREEIAFLEAYLAIEQTRFDARLSYRIDVDPQLQGARVPSLILQPLVENAVRHGLAGQPSPGRIDIAARRIGDMLELTVQDNGLGIDRAVQDGIGLSNTRARLKLLYGTQHSFELRPADEGGLRAALVIPLRAMEGA